MNQHDPFGLSGSVLDARYRVEQVVGEGGFGVVYRATQVNFDEPVAIKVLKLPPNLSEEQRGLAISTFRAEGKHLRKLSLEHPAFVRALDTGITQVNGLDAPYLVLEWLEGESLERELRHRRASGLHGRSLSDAMTLLEPIFEALAYAHAHRVAHRDIKPGNIFLVPAGTGTSAKLLDFGMAKVMSESTTEAMKAATQGGIAGLSPQYAAPEQWDKRLGATGPWTDVYALALVLVELLCDRPALIGDDIPQLMASTMSPERPTPSARGAGVSPQVEVVFLKALALHPRDRIRDARAFWNALAAAVRNEIGQGQGDIAKTVLMGPADLPETLVAPAATEPLGTPQRKAQAPFPLRALAMILLLALAVGGTVLIMWPRKEAPSGLSTAPSSSAAPVATSSAPAPAPESSKPPKPKIPSWFAILEAAPDRPLPPPSTPQAKWLSLHRQSLQLIQQKKFAQARATLLQALPLACSNIGEKDPACPETYKQLALAAVGMGKLDEAEKQLRKAVELLGAYGDPQMEDFYEPRRFLAALLRKMGKEEEALQFDIPPGEEMEASIEAPDASAPEAPAASEDAGVSADAGATPPRAPRKNPNDWNSYEELMEILAREKRAAAARRKKAMEQGKP